MSSELQHVNVKIFLDGELPVDPERFIEVFHHWIRDRVLDELLIDVADYRHVPAGPGVLLVAHEADYGMDHGSGRWGLLYNRKAPLAGNNVDRFEQATRRTALACRLLEKHFAEDRLRFSRQEFELFINDRALAPNTPETHQAHRAEVDSFLERVFGKNSFEITPRTDPRSRFGMHLRAAESFDLDAL